MTTRFDLFILLTMNTNSSTTSLKSSRFPYAENSYWTRWTETAIYWFADAADAESARADLTAQGWNVGIVDDGAAKKFRFRVVGSRARAQS